MTQPALHHGIEEVRRLITDGRVADAIRALERMASENPNDALLLQSVAEHYLKCGQHERAHRCYSRAVEMQPSNPEYLYNLAASKTAMGDLEAAEKLYTEVIRLKPRDHGAWLNRSALKNQTPENNHVEQLRYVKSHLDENDPGQVQICYALAKELEDLEKYDESFAYLQEGAHRRRSGMRYDIGEDESIMKAIRKQFNAERFAQPSGGYPSDRPIFILGLPRSGTTLVDRIVSSHSRVGSLGEHNTLPLALISLAGGTTDQAGDRSELVERSSNIDFGDLGRRYCQGIEGFGNPAIHLVDKTPLNFLYLGLIHLALPEARIIHLRRHPMDVCYAMYKTLFRAGYPFSYSLQETGRYYIAYDGLMSHWRAVIPEAFLEIDYESLVADQEGQTRRLLEYLELDWEDTCLDFHRHRGPSATASASQVRQPVYSTSVGLWKQYVAQLAPFAAKLRDYGIVID